VILALVLDRCNRSTDEVNAEVFGVLDGIIDGKFTVDELDPLLNYLSRMLPGMRNSKLYLEKYFLVIENLQAKFPKDRDLVD